MSGEPATIEVSPAPSATARRDAGPQGRLRLGIVGCGAIAESAHLPAALRSDRVDVVALADANKARLRYLQGQFGLRVAAASDYRELFDQVAAVVIALPNSLHAPVALQFLRRGIHVLCEKPLAPTSGECGELCEAARSNHVVLAVGYVTRFFPSTELTRTLLEEGLLGQLTSFDYEAGTARGWETISGYNLIRSSAGGGVLVVSGSHFMDRLLYLFGQPDVIRYEDDSRGGVEANCRIIVTCQVQGRSLPGEITFSRTHTLANRLRICGENGLLEVREGEARVVTFRPRRGGREHQISGGPAAKDGDYFRMQLEDFVDAIQSSTEPRVNGEQGSRSVALMEHCYGMATRIQEPWVDATLPRLWTGALRSDQP